MRSVIHSEHNWSALELRDKLSRWGFLLAFSLLTPTAWFFPAYFSVPAPSFHFGTTLIFFWGGFSSLFFAFHAHSVVFSVFFSTLTTSSYSTTKQHVPRVFFLFISRLCTYSLFFPLTFLSSQEHPKSICIKKPLRLTRSGFLIDLYFTYLMQPLL